MRAILAALALAVLGAVPAVAFDIGAMSDAERAAFRSEIRAYLLENPEVLMEAIAILEERRNQDAQAQERQLLEQNRGEIFADGYSWVGGNPDGDVTIVEFMDYRCGYCKRAYPALTELLATDGNIRFVVKEFPILGEASVLASRYAIATKAVAGDAAYGRVHDTLMRHNGDVNEAYLARLSRELGLDHDAILAGMDDPEVQAIIRANRTLGNRLEIQGTPSFVMGDNFVRGFIELDQMRAIVAAVRAGQG